MCFATAILDRHGHPFSVVFSLTGVPELFNFYGNGSLSCQLSSYRKGGVQKALLAMPRPPPDGTSDLPQLHAPQIGVNQHGILAMVFQMHRPDGLERDPTDSRPLGEVVQHILQATTWEDVNVLANQIDFSQYPYFRLSVMDLSGRPPISVFGERGQNHLDGIVSSDPRQSDRTRHYMVHPPSFGSNRVGKQLAMQFTTRFRQAIDSFTLSQQLRFHIDPPWAKLVPEGEVVGLVVAVTFNRQLGHVRMVQRLIWSSSTGKSVFWVRKTLPNGGLMDAFNEIGGNKIPLILPDDSDGPRRPGRAPKAVRRQRVLEHAAAYGDGVDFDLMPELQEE